MVAGWRRTRSHEHPRRADTAGIEARLDAAHERQDRVVAETRAGVTDLGITIHGTDADALERAGELATRCTLRFFDAVLVDRALQRGMPLLTSDRKLANAVGTAAPVEILRGIP